MVGTQEISDPRADQRIRSRAAWLSLVVAIVLLGAKSFAWWQTHSTAVLSDALESIVNVVAAMLAILGVYVAGLPADRNHPYGHGKVEFLAAAFEGGMIAFAALLIVWEAAQALWSGTELKSIDLGLWIIAAAGFFNLLLSVYLIRIGQQHHSPTLVADGKHVRSDFITSLGVVLGLLLVRITGLPWLDPMVAILVALLLLRTGAQLVREAAGGLLDEADPLLVKVLVAVLDKRLSGGVIRVHQLRAIRAGRLVHVNAHLVVPEFLSVDESHTLADELAASVQSELDRETDITFHADPCHRRYCAMCDVAACAVRVSPFVARQPLSIDEVVQPDHRPRRPD
ncbi:cation transporter [Planctomycetota bacterium]|jgi:cation diffusion facilitator family transporter|nr:cation diffusion facilitator family transporter [Planctomycetota bacterium]GDY01594.1 cation transporter [Planctomycetota bacterium]